MVDEVKKSDALKRLRNTAQALANELFHTEVTPCYGNHKDKSCIMEEEERPLSKQEKRDGWSRRPFYAYDPGRMCENCSAYWYASMCFNTLLSRYAMQVRVEAEEERKCATKPNELVTKETMNHE